MNLITVQVKTMFMSEYYTNKWGNRDKDILGWSVLCFIQDEEFLGDGFAEGAIELALYSKSALYRRHPKMTNLYEASEIEVLSPIYIDREGNKVDNLIIKSNDLLRLTYKSIDKKVNKRGQTMVMSCGREFYEAKIPLITGIVTPAEQKTLAYV